MHIRPTMQLTSLLKVPAPDSQQCGRQCQAVQANSEGALGQPAAQPWRSCTATLWERRPVV